MNELALFAGAGGGILGGHLLGWRTVCAVENDAYAASVLVARQNDGCLPAFPIWDDVRTFDGRPWRGRVDVVSGGFPCQDISVAGKGAGIGGERSGLWSEFARIICEVGPRFVFVENSPALTVRGLGTVLGDLASLGYDAEWGVLGADDAGAPHRRKRIWIVAHNPQHGRGARGAWRSDPSGAWERERPFQNVAYAEGEPWRTRLCANEPAEQRRGRPGDSGGANGVAGVELPRLEGHRADAGEQEEPEPRNDGQAVAVANPANEGNVRRGWVMGATERRDDERGSPADGCWQWWAAEPAVGRVANVVANRVDRLRCIGNGQVPAVAALAWTILRGRLVGAMPDSEIVRGEDCE